MSDQYKLISIKKSDKSDKKLAATFENIDTGRKRVTNFGAAGYSDYTIHKDKARKARYIARHSANENFEDPITAGALSLWILWNKPTLKASIESYKKHFKFS